MDFIRILFKVSCEMHKYIISLDYTSYIAIHFIQAPLQSMSEYHQIVVKELH